MRNIDPAAREVRKQYDDQVDAVEKRRCGATIARARFAHSGYDQPPDATFTLRLSYGAVKGYEENGKKIPYFTDMGGAFQHAAENGNKPPYQLPESWMKAKSKLKLDDSARLRVDGRHHRRQLGQPDREQEGRGRGHHLRRQHPVAGVEFHLRGRSRHERSTWIRAEFWKRCAKSTAQPVWWMN